MGFFSKKPRAGGIADVIRCDEPSYLIWKWHPYGSKQGFNSREAAIRWGSVLHVKAGEVAVFVYRQDDGIQMDFIEGPFDDAVETKNFPVLSSLIGLVYDGNSPFVAEVYFINLAQVIQIPFGVPYFDMYDPRFPDFGVPAAVRGVITFHISNYRSFVGLHRMQNFNLEDFRNEVRGAVARYVKAAVSNIPEEKNIPVVQIERQISLVNEIVEEKVKERFSREFGVDVISVDVGVIDIDKTSEGYRRLKAVTVDIDTATTMAQAEVNIQNMRDMQQINAENTQETLRIQREEAQYAQRKQTQTANFAAYQMEQQASVGIAGADALGQMGTNGASEMSGGGMNPAGLMAGMAVGGAVGQNIAGMMNNMMNGVNTAQAPGAVPPPVPTVSYHVVLNGKAEGPYGMDTLAGLVKNGSLTKDSLVWKQGLAEWVKAETIPDLADMISNSQTPPPVPNGQ